MNAAQIADLCFFLAGAAHIDRIAKAQAPFRVAASNPGTLTETVGGAACNAALVLAASGAAVTLWTSRGGDRDGVEVTGALQRAGVRDLAIRWLDRQTPTYTAILDDQGELAAGIADMALYDLLVPRFLRRVHVRRAIADSDALLLDTNLSGPTIEHLVTNAGSRPVGAIAVSPAKVGRLASTLPFLDALFLSRAEAAALVTASDGAGIDLLARRLCEMPLRRAVITDGPNPAAIIENGATFFQAPPTVAPRDVTGAGDTLAAVAFRARCAGSPWLDAVRQGMAAASLRIGGDAFPPADFDAVVGRKTMALAPPIPCTTG